MERLLKRFSLYYTEFILRNIQAKWVIFWLILTYFIYSVLLFVIIPELMAFSGGKLIFNIMPFGYSEEYVKELLSTMGEVGRKNYLHHLIPVDLFFPFMFAYSNFILTGYLLNRLEAVRDGFKYLCLLPVFASWFDYLENLGVMAMLVKYPDESNALVQFCDFFSVTKSLLITIYFVVLLTILFLIWKRKKRLFDSSK
jgi:hypothetical protein